MVGSISKKTRAKLEIEESGNIIKVTLVINPPLVMPKILAIIIG